MELAAGSPERRIVAQGGYRLRGTALRHHVAGTSFSAASALGGHAQLELDFIIKLMPARAWRSEISRSETRRQNTNDHGAMNRWRLAVENLEGIINTEFVAYRE